MSDVAAAAADTPFLKLSSHDMQSTEGKTYRIIVAPPTGPAKASGYSVIYVMDGNAWAPMVAEVVRANSLYSVISRTEPALVVGIGYPTELPFDVVRRHEDLTTPSTMQGYPLARLMPTQPGGYQAMARFIEHTVKPDIEQRYRIDRHRQTIVGHSLGGLFVLRTLLNRPDTFQRYVALSPSIWWNHGALLEEMATLRPEVGAKEARVYIGIGEFEQHETPAYKGEVRAQLQAWVSVNPALLDGRTFEATAAQAEEWTAACRMVDNARNMAGILRRKGVDVRLDIFPDEDHFSSVPSQIGRGIPFALRS